MIPPLRKCAESINLGLTLMMPGWRWRRATHLGRANSVHELAQFAAQRLCVSSQVTCRRENLTCCRSGGCCGFPNLANVRGDFFGFTKCVSDTVADDCSGFPLVLDSLGHLRRHNAHVLDRLADATDRFHGVFGCSL